MIMIALIIDLTLISVKTILLSFTHNNKENPAYVTNLNATAKEVKTTDIVLQAFAPSVINGNLTMTSSGGEAITEDEKKVQV